MSGDDLRRRTGSVLLHGALVSLALSLSFLLRFDFELSLMQRDNLLLSLPLLLAIRLPLFGYFRLYRSIWRYFGFPDVEDVFRAVTLGSVAFSMTVLFALGHGYPRSILILEYVLTMALLTGVRLGYRTLVNLNAEASRATHRRALVVGAGDAADLLLREIRRNPAMNYSVAGAVDDAPEKVGARIHGIDVLGPIDSLPELCQAHSIDEVLIAVPSASLEERRRILDKARASGVVFRTVPDMPDLLRGTARIGQLREVVPEDLLQREPLEIDRDRLAEEIRGKTVMVTGAAGSIGSELCRQLMRFVPAKIVLFERAESPLHLLRLELDRMSGGRVDVVPAIGDVQDPARVNAVMAQHRPDLVYHAAAYKHVHLMEEWPLDAIRNNIFGTEVVARAAICHGVPKMVLISTDKAVRPVSVMGMSKRVAEDLLLSHQDEGTRFIAVRFGNVLGSQGSVLPIFKWQIANGGPVTVTDPDARRYFMLISEAAQLVLQAGSLGDGGEVFFLDMGEPVRILDMAESLIRMAGYEPGREIKIEITGLKQGERLDEELIKDEEILGPTAHPAVRVVVNPEFAAGAFRSRLEKLRALASDGDAEATVETLRELAGAQHR